MAYWWVNQSTKHWRTEIVGGFLWAPQVSDADHSTNFHWTNMMALRKGDTVFSYSGKMIRAVGRVIEEAEVRPKPAFTRSDNNWGTTGWEAVVDWQILDLPFDPRIHLQTLNEHRTKYMPLNPSGRHSQGYLYSIPEAFGLALWGECGNTVGLFNSALDEEATSELIREAQEIIAGSAPTRTEVRQLIAARLGQGWFKKEVQQLEPRCRLTGVAEPTLLIASHMKPWRSSNNTERLTGANGLLLSPHVDRLFDRGLITFRDDGSLVTSPALSREVTSRWHINGAPYGGAFKEDQKPFLEYHRDEIFQSSTVS